MGAILNMIDISLPSIELGNTCPTWVLDPRWFENVQCMLLPGLEDQFTHMARGKCRLFGRLLDRTFASESLDNAALQQQGLCDQVPQIENTLKSFPRVAVKIRADHSGWLSPIHFQSYCIQELYRTNTWSA